MEYIISKEYDGICLRSYLRSVLNISRAELITLKKKEDGIVLNGKKVTVRAILKEGDILSLNRNDDISSLNIVPVELPLDIIYEDDDIIALNKPPYMPTHPSHEHQYDTLANALAFYFKNQNTPFVFRSVNRLDRDTSGIVLVAKNKSVAYKLSKDMSNFAFEKTYFVLAEGTIDNNFSVKANMKRCDDSSIKRCICSDDEGQYSFTGFEVINNYEKFTALYAKPKTGRTHQIRLHLSYAGFPIVGDSLYGNESTLIDRQCLHCVRLSFIHPVTDKKITLNAPIPSDISALIKGNENEQV